MTTNWRVEAMRSQIPPTGPVPVLVARPGLEAKEGMCLSCGEELEPGQVGRCKACGEAARVAVYGVT